jgi:hypothetical protein
LLLRAANSIRLPGIAAWSRTVIGTVVGSTREPDTSVTVSLACCSGSGQ